MRCISFICLSGLFLFLHAGCKQGAFLSTRFENFTAYYNRFYNAQDAFREGVKSIERSRQEINRDEYITLFVNADARGGSFEKVIKKSADLLRAYPRSKWVDDAILLIGKAYYYQGEYVGAEQKFNEVVQSEGPLQDEARFWLARTLIASRSYEEAGDLLRTALERPSTSEKWAGQMRLALGELYVRQKNWTAAATALERGVQRTVERELTARAYFLLGQVYETLTEYEKSARAYRAVTGLKPSYELIYAASMAEAEVSGLKVRPDLGLNILKRLAKDDKYYKQRGEINLLKGRILAKRGEVQEAYNVFYTLLYDKNANATNIRGKVHYAMGQMFRDQVKDFKRAGAHFDTSATSLRTNIGEGAKMFTPSAIMDASKLSSTFKGFNKTAIRVHEIDSLLWVAGLNRKGFDSLMTIARQRKEKEQLALQAEAERRQAEAQFQAGNQSRLNNTAALTRPGESMPGGFLGHLDPVRVQQGKNDFKQKWGERPLMPNWRRKAAIGSLNTAGTAKNDSLRNAQREAALAQAKKGVIVIDTSAVPRTVSHKQKLVFERADKRYELGNTLFLSLNMPDSAAVWYRLVIDDEKNTPVAQRAYFALAELQRSMKDTNTSNRLYQLIIDQFPDSDFAVQARERLGLPSAVNATLRDTTQISAQIYRAGYEKWEAKQYRAAINQFLELVQRYPQSKLVPQALLATGRTYTEWALVDGKDLWAEIPFERLVRVAKDTIKTGLQTTPKEEVGPTAVEKPNETVVPLQVPPKEGNEDAPINRAVKEGDEAPVRRPPSSPPVAIGTKPTDVTKPKDILEAPLTLENLYDRLGVQFGASPYGKEAIVLKKALLAHKPIPKTTQAKPDSVQTKPLLEAAKPAPEPAKPVQAGDGGDAPIARKPVNRVTPIKEEEEVPISPKPPVAKPNLPSPTKDQAPERDQ